LYAIKAVLVLDADGTRLLAKYYRPCGDQYQSVKEQTAFEHGLFEKTRKASGEILLYDGQVVSYRSAADLLVAVVGLADENELLIAAALNAYVEAITTLLKHQLEKRTFIENFDLMALALDECIDDGIIFEVDPNLIVARVSKRGYDTAEVAVAEQTLLQAYQTAKERLTSSLLR